MGIMGALQPDGWAALTWDDPAIVQALLAQQEGAWDYFVERFAGLVSGVVQRILAGCGVRPSGADVDDISENVFVMLLENDSALLRRYDPQHRLAAYLSVIARTAAHRWLRRRRVKAHVPDEMWTEAFADEGRLTTSDETTQRELLAAVREEVQGLSERDRTVLELFYYQGQDYQAIAERLGVSVNSVGAALSRARARLGKALQEHRDLTESDLRV
jgi:RNA polymerase sigma-70 factor (ECF subfamily)